ncbi:cysteine-rich repeat secretory protein 38-like [Juglans microcarpa x Juglans regia]|uniref:cysteine-rich repeat secretory protein 38-like n=1 Tax=Juglans microcarpa x Juglans regia TaxID=2249226 RepID=UPI001B7E204F|nr:cysteine-rich repeat secretory protein 38-like [Juglans microcarpa x Juglans regia]
MIYSQIVKEDRGSEEMETFHFAIVCVILSAIALSSCPCHAITNVNTGFECSEADGSATENAFQTNLKNLLDTLVVKVPVSNGFYKTETGKKSNKLYGLVQCRGDMSAGDCANCTKNAVAAALKECPKSKQVWTWFTWCFLRYSDQSFFGIMDQTSAAITNDTDFDDPYVVSKGLDFMGGLASTAPNQPHMFQKAVLDVGKSGKRYGMAQCTLDINRADCGKCLDSQLTLFRTIIGNKRGWETYGSSCFMWYHDYLFYFNISTPASEGTRRPSSHIGVTISVIIGMLALLAVV